MALAALVLAIFGVVIVTSGGDDSRESQLLRNRKLVAGYCLYGSENPDALIACEKRTTAAQVRRRDDHAAQYARRELGECREDAGDLCGELYRGVVENRVERQVAVFEARD